MESEDNVKMTSLVRLEEMSEGNKYCQYAICVCCFLWDRGWPRIRNQSEYFLFLYSEGQISTSEI